MPVDDIIEEVSADRTRHHARQRRPGGESGSSSAASADSAVPTTRSPTHSPRAHYEKLNGRLEVDRENVKFAGTVFGIVSGVIRLL